MARPWPITTWSAEKPWPSRRIAPSPSYRHEPQSIGDDDDTQNGQKNDERTGDDRRGCLCRISVRWKRRHSRSPTRLRQPLASDTESTEDAESANQDEDVSPGDDEPADEPETLEDYLGTDFFSFDPEAQAANRARQEQQVQELIAECMTREGFEYIAVTRPFDDFGFGGPEDVEFAADFGFGITTFYGETEPPLFQDYWIDPNQAIVEGLSESETKRILRHAARIVVQQRWLRVRHRQRHCYRCRRLGGGGGC